MRATVVTTIMLGGLLGCARPLAPPAAKAAQPRPASGCFGGPVEVVQARAGVAGIDISDRNGNPLFIGDGHLILSQGQHGPALFDLTTGNPGHARLGYNVFFKTADSHEVYSVSVESPWESEHTLVAVDVQTGERRTVVGGKDRGNVSVSSQVALDGDFAYFIRSRVGAPPEPRDGFYRARRDGTGATERLGDEPKGAYTPFLVHDGYVYWNRDPDYRDPGKGGPALWRRRLVADSPVERLAPTHDHHLPLAIADGRLFYRDGREILSVPLDGSAPPRSQVKDTGLRPQNLVVAQGCLYWGSERGILRVGVAGAGQPELIVDEANYRGGPLASDSQSLYWLDHRNDRILRMGRGDHVLAPHPVLVAKPIDGKALPPDAAGQGSAVWVGDGWGCAKVFGWNQPHWQCWRAGGKGGERLRGQTVPWLSPQAAPIIAGDRLCFLDGKQSRCLPASALGPTPPPSFTEPGDTRGGRRQGQGQVDDGPLLLGTSFECIMQYIGSERMLACSGDDRFGQLATKEQPAMLEPWIGAVGGWHGCVAAKSRHGLACWGRGDAGQLGRAPEAECAVENRRIVCDANVRPVAFQANGVAKLYGGDLFTCMNEGIHGDLSCWGGSRDGWFVDTPCSAELRQAWPVGEGFVAAPKATCTATPVKVSLIAGRDHVSIGSRGLCATVNGKPLCLGAIATPDAPVGQIVVSPGSHASACGISGTQIVCWGEDYSPPDQPSRTVSIGLTSSMPASAVVDFPPPAGGTWSADHLVHTGCQRGAAVLPACSAGATGKPWAAWLASGALQKNAAISVRDRLVVGLPANTTEVNTFCPGQAHNPRQREDGPPLPGTNFMGCYRDQRPIVLGDGPDPLHFSDSSGRFDCYGDESRLCCGSQAFGQTVVATGPLVGSQESGWRIKVESLCEVSPAVASGPGADASHGAQSKDAKKPN